MKLPGFDQFVLPFGRSTNPNYSTNAADAWGTLLGTLAQSDAYEKTGLATADANKYGAYAGGLGQSYGTYGSALANLYGTLGSTASNGAAASANVYGGLAGGLSNLGQSRAAAAAAEDNAYTGLAVGMAGSNADLYGDYSSALQGLAGAQASESAGLANAFAGMQTGLANSVANTYGNYTGGLGHIAQSMAAERAANYNSNAMAEAARQASVGNIGSAALGAYGSAAGSALNSWGQAESAYQNSRGNIGSAYMNSMGGLGTANQAAISNIGSTRNQALGSLGQSYANASQGLAAASAVGDLDLSFQDYGYPGGAGGGGEFSASGPNGLIASGSYGGGGGVPGSGGMSLNATRTSDNSKLDSVIGGTFGGLENTANQLDNQEAYGQLAAGLGASHGALGSGFGQAIAGMRPDYGFLTNTLGKAGGEIRGLAGQGYSAAGSGMDQYYAQQPQTTDYTPLMDLLTSGYNNASNAVGQYGGDSGVFERSDFSDYASQLASGFGDSRGDLASLSNRGFDSIAGSQYGDEDLLAGLVGGYGPALWNINQLTGMGASQFADSANALGAGLTNTNQMLSAGYTPAAAAGGGSLASELLNSMEDSQRKSTPWLDALRGEYTQLIRAGGTERFNPYSGSYDQAAAQRKAWLEGQLKGGQPREAYA